MTAHEKIEPGLRLETTDDGFLGGALKILQPKRGYRAGLEAVFLAASIPAASGDKALEAGCGVGVASLCLARRVGDVAVTGVEIEPELAELGCENASRNRLGHMVNISLSDVCRAREEPDFGCNTQDHVFANPPFFTSGRARRSNDPLKNRAHICDPEDLDSWVRFPGLAGRADRHCDDHLPGRGIGRTASSAQPPGRQLPCLSALPARVAAGQPRHRPGHQRLARAGYASARSRAPWRRRRVHLRGPVDPASRCGASIDVTGACRAARRRVSMAP